MAEKRMFTMKICDSDAFLDMPLSTQCLYFHLNMRADDDGFINNPKRVQKLINASDDDLKLLIAKRFLLLFEHGVIVIKHWRMHNTIQSDRYKPTAYQEELRQLVIKDNKSYTFLSDEIQDVPKLETKCFQNVSAGLDIGLDIEKDIEIEKEKEKKKKVGIAIPPDIEDVKTYCIERNNNVDVNKWFDFYTSKGWKIGKEKMKDWKASIRTWEKGNTKKNEDWRNF